MFTENSRTRPRTRTIHAATIHATRAPGDQQNTHKKKETKKEKKETEDGEENNGGLLKEMRRNKTNPKTTIKRQSGSFLIGTGFKTSLLMSVFGKAHLMGWLNTQKGVSAIAHVLGAHALVVKDHPWNKTSLFSTPI